MIGWLETVAVSISFPVTCSCVFMFISPKIRDGSPLSSFIDLWAFRRCADWENFLLLSSQVESREHEGTGDDTNTLLALIIIIFFKKMSPFVVLGG